MFQYKRTLLLFAGLLTAATLMAQNVRMDVNLKKPGAITPRQRMFFGEGKAVKATVDPMSFNIFVFER